MNNKHKAHLITSTNLWEPPPVVKCLMGSLMVLGILGILGGSIMLVISILEPDHENIQQTYRILGCLLIVVSPVLLLLSFGLYFLARRHKRSRRKKDVLIRTIYTLGYDPTTTVDKTQDNKKSQRQGYHLLSRRQDQVHPKRSFKRRGYEDTEKGQPRQYSMHSEPHHQSTSQKQGPWQYRATIEQEQRLQEFIVRQQKYQDVKEKCQRQFDVEQQQTGKHRNSQNVTKKQQPSEEKPQHSRSKSRDISADKSYRHTFDDHLPKEAVKTLNQDHSSKLKGDSRSENVNETSGVTTAEIELKNLPPSYARVSQEPKQTSRAYKIRDYPPNQQDPSSPDESSPADAIKTPSQSFSQIDGKQKRKPPTPQGTSKLDLLEENQSETPANTQQCTCHLKKKTRKSETPSSVQSASSPRDDIADQQVLSETISPGQSAQHPVASPTPVTPPNEYQVYSLYDIVSTMPETVITQNYAPRSKKSEKNPYSQCGSTKFKINEIEHITGDYKLRTGILDKRNPRKKSRKTPCKPKDLLYPPRDSTKHDADDKKSYNDPDFNENYPSCTTDELLQFQGQEYFVINSDLFAWDDKDAGYSSGSHRPNCRSESSLCSDDSGQFSPTYGNMLTTSEQEMAVRFLPRQGNPYDVDAASEDVDLSRRRPLSWQRPLSLYSDQRPISFISDLNLSTCATQNSTSSSRPPSSTYDDLSDYDTSTEHVSMLRTSDGEFVDDDAGDEQMAFL